MTQGGVSIDVQDQLLKERSRKRKSGTVPYPVKDSRDSLVYENWNVMFLTSLCRSLTLHQFETPPSRILDLGCGGGLWVIEAAKQWPASTVVGFDILENQPNLGRPEFELLDIAQRVSFVAGNVLDPLPFSANQFDFVRVCGIGLGVPEDEWQFLLEECARVIKPGGCIEIIEEDLIFPCGKPSTTYTLPYLSSQSSTLVSPSPAAFSQFGGSTSALSCSSGQSSRSSGRQPSFSASSALSWPKQDCSSQDSLRDRPFRELEIKELLDPQDHSKLKTAWLEMLHHRFLNPRLLSVLPFYLSSSFTEVQAYPTLHITLPPNSQVDSKDDIPSPTHFVEREPAETGEVSALYFDVQQHSFKLSSDSRTESSAASQRSSKTVSTWASIHLARTVQLIRGCKEEIFEEYKKLEQSPEFLTFPGLKYDVSDEFEAAWTNWENDMQDRMAMRGKLQETLAWNEPDMSGKDDDGPAWKAWRKRAGDIEIDDTESTIGCENICRSLRGFVAWKPDKTDAEANGMDG